MRRSLNVTGLLVAGALILPCVSGNPALASGKKEEFKPQGAAVKLLTSEPLQGVKNWKVTIRQLTAPPGWIGGQHYHTGSTYVYVLQGSFTLIEKGKTPRTLPAGSLFKESIGNPMEARNLSSSEPFKVLVIQIGNKDEPLMVKTKF